MHKPLSNTTIKKLNRTFSEELLQKEIVFVLQDIEDPINVGHFFRIADGLAATLLLTGHTPKPNNELVKKTSMGLQRSVNYEYITSFKKGIELLQKEDFQLVGVEVDTRSQLYSEVQYSSKVALVLGNEAKGIYKKNLPLLDEIVAIPMLGKGLSLNVHVAGAVVGYYTLLA